MNKFIATVLGAALVLTGCSAGAPRDERQSFIDASVEATCLVFESDNLFDPALDQQIIDIFKNYGFPADDDEAMDALSLKYENDAEVTEAINSALEECAPDFSEYTDEMRGVEEAVVEEAVAEEAVVEDAVVEDAVVEDETVVE
jgi:hypothetical protein